jgi:hypothetical protein
MTTPVTIVGAKPPRPQAISRRTRPRPSRNGSSANGPASRHWSARRNGSPCARSWLSRTWYRPTRHPHRKRDATEALHSDLLGECARRRLPRPEVEVIDILSGPRGGIAGRFRLRFDVAVEGPLLLGAGSHFGAGLFAAEYDGPST